MWKTVNLTTASNNQKIDFEDKTYIHAEGTFGGGTFDVHAIVQNSPGQLQVISSDPVYQIDGATVTPIEVPPGLYKLALSDSTGGDIDVFYTARR